MCVYLLAGLIGLVGWLVLVVLLHVKKTKQPCPKSASKVAFFHPFWCLSSDAATMQVEAKKCYGQ
jgi:hypothetical protein